jgi:hypothetical protein
MKKEFPSWEAFMGWKESEEAATHTYFSQPKGKSTSDLENPGQLLVKPATPNRYNPLDPLNTKLCCHIIGNSHGSISVDCILL